MASRMDKYYNRRLENAKRSERNRLLYQRLDIINDDDDFERPLDRNYEGDLTRLKTIFKDYDDYRYGKYPSEEENIADELDYDVYDDLKFDYESYQNNDINDKYKEDSFEKADKKIEELVDIIKINSQLNTNDKQSSNKDENNEYVLKADKITGDEDQELISSQILNKDDRLNKTNLKIKIIVGIIFIINTMLIVFLIYKSVK